MSISALSSNLVNDLSQQQSPFLQSRLDFKQLAGALQSGDLAGAQSAYSSLQQLLKGAPSNAASSVPTTIQNDFASLGQALQSGDLNQAQNAFSQLQSDFKATREAPKVTLQLVDQFVPSSPQQAPTPQPASPVAQPSVVQPGVVQVVQPGVVQQVQQDFAQINSSLQSGDLSTAQSAFANLQKALQTQSSSAPSTTSQSPSTTSSPNSSDPITNDFAALGQALATNNLSQAQAAFSQLQNDVQSAQKTDGSPSQSLTQGFETLVQGHHHHHHHGGGGSSETSSTPAPSSTNSSAPGNVNVTINIYA